MFSRNKFKSRESVNLMINSKTESFTCILLYEKREI